MGDGPAKKKRKPRCSFRITKRSDLVFKTILRKIRKIYLNDFNFTTNYIKSKKFYPTTYLGECMKSYISEKFPKIL